MNNPLPEDANIKYPLEGGFHWRDCWYFKRMSGGHVRITHAEVGKEVVQLLIHPSEWASIVASVSHAGESNGRWTQACDFHGGSTVLDNDSADIRHAEGI